MEALNDLEQNVSQLIERYRQQQQQIADLKKENADQRQEILRSHSELATLQKQYKHLQEANAMLGSAESRDAAKRHLTNLIAQVDNALEILKS